MGAFQYRRRRDPRPRERDNSLQQITVYSRTCCVEFTDVEESDPSLADLVNRPKVPVFKSFFFPLKNCDVSLQLFHYPVGKKLAL
jgi:hypothetical protein